MEPPVLEGDEFQEGSPDLFARIWEEFESHKEEIATYRAGESYYGVSLPTAEDEVFEYLAGTMVEKDAPPGRRYHRATFQPRDVHKKR